MPRPGGLSGFTGRPMSRPWNGSPLSRVNTLVATGAKPKTLVLLPGMDGGTTLSESFRRALPDSLCATAIAYPPDDPLGYDELEELVRARLADVEGPFVLVAESFSGPIAVRIAAAPPPGLVGLVVVASFVRPPLPSILKLAARPALFRFPLPRSVVRRYLLGESADDQAVDEVLAAVASTSPEALARRVREILSVDVRDSFSSIRLPTLWIEAAQDRVLKPATDTLAALNPKVEVTSLDAPHLLLRSSPREAVALVNVFFVQIPWPD